MKKFILINVLLIIIALQLHSQPPWIRISPNPIESSLKEITRIPGTDRMMAIGSGASILYTDDMGENWNIQYKPADIPREITLNAIYFIDANIGYIVGTESTLIKTTDGGMNWVDVSPTGNDVFFDVFFFTELIGFYTTNLSIWKTIDGCQSWNLVTVEGSLWRPQHLNFIGDSVGFCSNTNSEYYFRSIDAGNSWDSLSINPGIDEFKISDIQFLTDSIGFISGSAHYGSHSDKFILKTTDGGASWSQAYEDSFNFVHDIYFHNSDTGFAVGPRIMYDNVILMTTDAGENWQECEMPYSSWSLNSLVFSDNGIGICVGDHGQIFSSFDWGKNWVVTDDHLTILRSIKDAQVLDDSIVYIGGISYGGIQGCVYKSINSGQSWNRVFDGIAITSVYFINSETGYACGPGLGEVYKTINGGQSWETIEIDSYGFNPERVLFINDSIGFVGGDQTDYGYYKTIDGGNNWYLPDSSTLYGFHDIAFLDDSTGIAIFSDIDYIARTYDQGETWEYASLGYDTWFNRIIFISNEIGFILGHNILLKTTDRGTNWYEVPSGLTGITNFNDINFPSDLVGYITLSGNEIQIIKTTDDGETWFPVDFPCTATPTTVDFFSENEGLIMGGGGIIFKTYTGGIVGVPESPIDIESQSNIICYPNPVSEIINIKLNDISLPNILVFYNSYGKKIRGIEVHEKQKTISIDVSGWTSGVYFITVLNNGEIVESGKFIKLK